MRQKIFYIRTISRLVCICNLQHRWKFWTGVSYDCETSEIEWKEWVKEICTKNLDAQKHTPGQNTSHHLSGGLDDIAELCCPLEVVWIGGSHTSKLTSYLKSTWLLPLVWNFHQNSVQPLQRYYNIQAHSNVGTENLNFGNPSNLMTRQSHICSMAHQL